MITVSKSNSQLGTEKISTLLLKLSLPATTGMLVTTLYNIIDTIFVGIMGIWISFPLPDLSSAVVTGLMLKKELKNISIDLKISSPL